MPDLDYDGNAARSGRATKGEPAPLLEGAIGVFRGLSGGHLAIDLLGSAQLLPTDQVDDITVSDDATSVGGVALSFGFGARVTVLGGAGAAPAVSVSAMRRTLPRVDVGDVPGGDRFAFGADLEATNLRIVVGKQFGPLSLAAGYGRDTFTGDAQIAFRDPLTNAVQPPIAVDLDTSRSMGFVNLGLGVGMVRFGAEVGIQQGRDLGLGTTFESNDPSEGRLFGGAGIRIAF